MTETPLKRPFPARCAGKGVLRRHLFIRIKSLKTQKMLYQNTKKNVSTEIQVVSFVKTFVLNISAAFIVSYCRKISYILFCTKFQQNILYILIKIRVILSKTSEKMTKILKK